MKRLKAGWMMMAALCLVLAIALPALAADAIKIGVIGPMNFVQGKGTGTGQPWPPMRSMPWEASRLAARRMMIELVKADSNEFLNITDATNAMERLMTQDKVDFVVGGFRTEAVLAMQDIAMDHKKIFIGCGAAHPELCNVWPRTMTTYKYLFRGTPFNSRFLVQDKLHSFGHRRGHIEKILEFAPGESRRRRGKGHVGGAHDQGGGRRHPQDGHGGGRAFGDPLRWQPM